MKTLVLLLTVATISFAQDDPELKPFITKGFTISQVAIGDFNGDGKPDKIVVLDFESEAKKEENRPLLILLRGANGKLSLTKKISKALLCQSCGGTMGDPLQEIEVEKNGFAISYYGGSSWRWGMSYRFRYDAALKTWVLYQYNDVTTRPAFEEDSKEAQEEGVVEEDFTIPEAELLAKTPIEQFDSENFPASEKGAKWLITAPKARFYAQPSTTNPKKAYLLKGDEVAVYQLTKNFVRATYTNKAGRTTSGFLLRKEVTKKE